MFSTLRRLQVNGKLLLVLLLVGALLSGTFALAAAADEPGEANFHADRFPAAQGNDSGTLWAVGDGADGSLRARALAQTILAAEPQAFAYLGDVYQEGSLLEFGYNYEPVYGQLKSLTLPTPGNHDWPAHAEGYDQYWANVIGGKPPHHYSTSIAGWQILSLNSEDSLEPGSRQVRWLSRQVSTGGDCRIAFWHRPRYSAGSHEDDVSVEWLWQAVEGRAALVLNGHEHNSQEHLPRGGTVQLVAGAGGRSQYPLNASDPRLAWSNTTDDAALRLQLSPGHVSYDYVSTAGAVLRSGTASCDPS